MNIMPTVLKKIDQTQPATFGMGAVSIVILAILQFVGNKWDQKSPALHLFCSSRNLFVLGTFTGISYFVNKNRETPLWQILGTFTTTIPGPTAPLGVLIQNLILPSLALFFSMTLEHAATAKAFGHQHGYTFNQSQESVSIGVINLLNSMFGALPVSGGDMARSSVLATSGSKSLLNGVFSSLTVTVAMYALSGTLQYMPAPTVAAVIMVAIFDQMPPQALIGMYWKISFVDFLHFLLAFNFTMLATTSIGIDLSFGFMVMYTRMRVIFSRPKRLVSVDLQQKYSNDTPTWWGKGDVIPAGTQVITLETDVMFLNADRIKRHVLDTVCASQSGTPSSIHPLVRPWNVRRDKHIADLRRRAGVNSVDTFIPRLRIVVLDFASVSFVDTTGMQAFEAIKKELLDYGGLNTEFRFVGICKGVRRRFERAGWGLKDPHDEPEMAITV